MGDAASLKGLVCSGDAMVRQTAAAAIQHAGYELVGETENGPDTLGLGRFVEPDVIVLDNDLPVRSGVEWIAELLAAHPTSAILLLANDEHIRSRAMENGAFGVVYRSQMGELEGALGRARSWLLDPDLRQVGERRTGKDRRHHEDWTKVTGERRSGAERRLREPDPGPAPTGP